MQNCLSAKYALSLAVLLVAGTLLLAPAAGLAEGVNLSDCLVGCPPGNTLCTDCCARQFPNQSQTSCDEAFLDCNTKCEGFVGFKALTCYKQCQSEVRACLGQSPSPKASFNCPGWVQPQQCDSCETWSPTLQKCVGAPKEICDPQ